MTTATENRWIDALARARSTGVRLMTVRGTGRFVALSGTDGATAYEVTATTCTCPAGEKYDVCKHRAAYRSATWAAPFGPLAV